MNKPKPIPGAPGRKPAIEWSDRVRLVALDRISVGERHRQIDPATAASLRASIAVHGLIHPPRRRAGDADARGGVSNLPPPRTADHSIDDFERREPIMLNHRTKTANPSPAGPTIPPPPAEIKPFSWVRWYRETVAALTPTHGRLEAERRTWDMAREAWRRHHAKPPAPQLCAGCLQPLPDDDRLALPDSVYVHASKPSCRADAAFRRLQSQERALLALGLTQPTRRDA